MRVDWRAERDELEPVGPGDGHTDYGGIHTNEATWYELDLVAGDTHGSGPLHHEVDLFLVGIAVLVLPAFLIRREDEVVEAESLAVDRAANFPRPST